MLKLLQYIDNLPLEKPEGNKSKCINKAYSIHEASVLPLYKIQWVMKSVFPVFEGKNLLRRKNHEFSHFLTLELLTGWLAIWMTVQGFALTKGLFKHLIEWWTDYECLVLSKVLMFQALALCQSESLLISSDEGSTLGRSAFKSLYSGQIADNTKHLFPLLT